MNKRFLIEFICISVVLITGFGLIFHSTGFLFTLGVCLAVLSSITSFFWVIRMSKNTKRAPKSSTPQSLEKNIKTNNILIAGACFSTLCFLFAFCGSFFFEKSPEFLWLIPILTSISVLPGLLRQRKQLYKNIDDEKESCK